METLLLIDKPKGITSFDVIRKLRRQLGIKKMGHAGTLDPLATGLLLIGVGQGTKELHTLLKLDKTYVAEVLFGKQTDTGDLEGKIIDEKPIPTLTKELLVEALKTMTGDIKLKVPAYSAIKKDGKPLYKYARENTKVEIPTKTMSVISYNIVSIDEKSVSIEWSVKSGTYIRSLAQELGKRIGTVATLKNLRRTQIGEYSVEQAQKIPD
ncbi:MAG: tRNA pseudouridine(55) synthase TruB [bacterium]|nr:tRNA pseudouridine(55) synthase TruB [bacterium]